MRRRGRPWSDRRWRRFNEKRDKQIAQQIRCEDEAAAFAEYAEEKRRLELAEEFEAIAKATNQLVIPFDDSPMGGACFEMPVSKRSRARHQREQPPAREVLEPLDISVESAGRDLAWWHR